MVSATDSFEFAVREGFKDPNGETVKSLASELRLPVKKVRTIDVLETTEPIEDEEQDPIFDNLFDGKSQEFFPSEDWVSEEWDYYVHIGFKPGVTDNVGETAREAAQDALKRPIRGQFFSSRAFLIKGDLTHEQVELLVNGLANPLIQRWKITSLQAFEDEAAASGDFSISPLMELPVVTEIKSKPSKYINLNLDDTGLLSLLKSRNLAGAVSLQEIKTIRDYFAKSEVIEERKKVGLAEKPTDVEIESLAQTWSEHCKHKIFNAKIEYREGDIIFTINSILKTLIAGSTEKIQARWILQGKTDPLLSVFEDNAGVVIFDKETAFAAKVETHNHPSNIEPFGGANTGIGGVIRDIMGVGLGAKPIASSDVFCVGYPNTPSHKIPPEVFHPARLLKGVVKGVKDYGNKIGIPTVNGAVVFDDSFALRALVYCGTFGIMPRYINEKPTHVKQAQPGDLVVLVGGKTGADGIHGATGSSGMLEIITEQEVQIGAPIIEKRLLDAQLEARDLGLYNSVTDNGAGGISCSVGEMAKESGGAKIELNNVPLKYQGLSAWEILVSESQERMTFAVPQEKLPQFLQIMKKHGVEATVLGEFTNTEKFHVTQNNNTVAYLDMHFMHDGAPQLQLQAEWAAPALKEPEFHIKERDYTRTLERLLVNPNIASKEWLIRQYDHEVQGMSVIKPLMGAQNDGPSDAAVLKPLADSFRGLAIASGINPRYSTIDTYHMAALAIDEAIRNAVAVGADPDKIYLLDNFCWPKTVGVEDGKQKLAQLVRAAQACYDMAVAFETPFISGKDSMSNDRVVDGKCYSVKPTLLITAVGVVDDIRHCVSMDAKQAGDLVYVIGTTNDELGASLYYKLHDELGANVPKVNAAEAKQTYRALHNAIRQNLVASCHDVSDGGLAVALAETAFAGSLGMEIDLRRVVATTDQNDVILFSESASRFVVTVAPQFKEQFEAAMEAVPYSKIGQTTSDNKFGITGLEGRSVVYADVAKLKESWQEPFQKW